MRRVIFWLAIMAPSAAALGADDYGIEQRLTELAGARAARCGHFRRPPASTPGPLALSRDENQAVSQCMTAAYRRKQGFFYLVEAPGADSFLAGGLVGTPARVVKRFAFVSSCRPRRPDEPGAGAVCHQEFTTSPCSPPKTGRLSADLACK